MFCTFDHLSAKPMCHRANQRKYGTEAFMDETTTGVKGVRNLTETEKACLAGVIDGEGSVGIYRSADGRRIEVQVCNTRFGFIAKIRDVVGCGSICTRHFHGSLHKGRKPLYQYTMKGSERRLKLLEQVLPYLIVKREKAEAILNELRTHPFGRWVAAPPEARARASERMKASWRDPDVRRRRIDGMPRHRAGRRGG